MISVRTRFLAALIALAPAAGLLVASPAQAAGTSIKVKSVSVSTSTVVLGAGTGCKKITFKAKLNKAMPKTSSKLGLVGIDLYGPGNKVVGGAMLKRVGSTTTYKGGLELCSDGALGKYRAETYGIILTKDFEITATTNKIKKYLFLKRPSKLTLDASPEPVVKGQTLTATGALAIDGKALANAKVKIYFKAKGASSYKFKGTAVTDAAGSYTKQFTATKNGTWKAVFAGSNSRDKAAAVDVIKVKK
ncbi:hypothetical protein [Actinoplanes aureus]|uniref:Uncharacterized protein n=1 Tax=Actinoplanes aureus TaxID=2792083 RepID=A0A931C056_9ACTN|nr:hypothetical protein [Actinoplanes aureus]MBG0560840.1 hypothetical protein [Actinoplanes aureus]